MSAGGILEIPAFLISLSGLIPLAREAYGLWQLISDCQSFSDDLAKTMYTLYFEYALFDAWCKGVGIPRTEAGAFSLVRPIPPRPPAGTDTTTDDLPHQSYLPFSTIVSQIVAILKKIKEITMKLRNVQGSHGVDAGMVGTATQGALAVALPGAALPVYAYSQRESWKRGLTKVPFFRRAKHLVPTSASKSERDQLEQLIGEFAVQNRKLWEFLPSTVKDAVLTKYLPVTVFDIPFDRQELGIVREASRVNFMAISGTAHLWMERERIESAQGEVVCPPVSYDRLHLYKARKGPWQSVTVKEVDGRSSRRAVVEWYEYQNLTDEQTTVSIKRINNLSQITRVSPASSDLRILTSPGYVDHTDGDGRHFGLLFDLPAAADPSKTPVNLFSLFERGKDKRAPEELSLRQKFILANQLATSLAAFHRVHWYHKNFSANSVVFFYSRTEPKNLLLSHPYISGFGFSRPDNPDGISLNPTWEMHVHPELERDGDPTRPKFQRRHDIYSLGILLFDIGTWGRAQRYTNDGAEGFRQKLLSHATDLRGRMGVEYMEVTKWCLCPPEEEPQIGLETFYWEVLHVLANCHCSAKE